MESIYGRKELLVKLLPVTMNTMNTMRLLKETIES